MPFGARVGHRLAAPAVGLALLIGAWAAAQSFRPPPAPTEWVTDPAGFLSEGARRSLNARLQRYERDTGHQVIVWIGRDTGGVPLEEWAARTFEAWGIGRKGQDDGVALFVLADERKLRIEVGYGLEGVVPDAIAHRIIDEQIVPRLGEGRNDEAISAGVSALLLTIGGERGPPAAPISPRVQPRPSLGRSILWAVVGLALLLLFITHPRLAMYFLFSILSGGRHGGGFGSGRGGGFSGGGGRSGGGGASGSW